MSISKKKTLIPKPVEVRVMPTKEIVSDRIYSNYVQVSHSLYDSTLTFCDIPPADSEQINADILKSKKMNAPIQVEVVIPNSLVEPLIKALTESYEKHKAKLK